jgi:hypothetical protein
MHEVGDTLLTGTGFPALCHAQSNSDAPKMSDGQYGRPENYLFPRVKSDRNFFRIPRGATAIRPVSVFGWAVAARQPRDRTSAEPVATGRVNNVIAPDPAEQMERMREPG